MDPTEGNCKGLAAWHIGKVHFTIGSNDDRNSNSNNDNTSIDLANLNIVLAVHAPGHMFRGTKWKIAVYLDQRADNHQKYALTKIYTGQVGGEFFAEILARIEEVLRIKSIPIEFSIEGKKRLKIKIPFITEMEIEGLAGRDPDIDQKLSIHVFQILLAMIPLFLA